MNRLCHNCWKVALPGRAVCAACNPVYGGTPRWQFFNTAYERFLNMLWTVFQHAEILEQTTIGDTDIEVDFYVPEYALAIDMVQDIPKEKLGILDLEVEERQNLDWAIDHVLSSNGTRYVQLPPDVVVARNRLVKMLNRFSVEYRVSVTGQLHKPRYQNDVGWDVICSTDTECLPHKLTNVPSDLFMAIPDHLYGLVQARSSTSKQELLVLPGLIDPGWRGKILVMTYNLADSPTVIKEGKSIAQMIFLHRVLGLNREDVGKLRPSDRQDKGFGSTGK